MSDVPVDKQLAFHLAHGRKSTVTAVRPRARFGALDLDGAQVTGFREKLDTEGGYINGGFFVLDPSVIELIPGDDTVWEHQPLERLVADQQLQAFQHDGFWQPMDTLRDRNYLNDLWERGQAPWSIPPPRP